MEKKVLAIVDGNEITMDDFNFFMESLNPQVRAYFTDGDKKKEIIDELIYQELLYLDAIENKLDEDEEFVTVSERTKASLLKTYALGKLLENVSPSEKEIEEFYNANAEHYDVPNSVDASHILVEDENKANELYNKILAGENFEELAKNNSMCPSKNNGGNLGVFHSGQMVREFDEKVFSMKEGEISEPVKTNFGFHIIKLNKIIPSKKHTLSEVRDDVIKEVKRYKEQNIYMNKIRELSQKHNIKVLNIEPEK
ncbi:peptidylprolyl isomerase [Peptoniphilus mikwangii]|uniref:peptidylprolyl isomerase n=1 Tax=Peptoniphilus mikwangii TaxID=1354300 RepID=UPI00041E2451|nr:peptidylprolyl isomerase [Peptoniphilus mikwangii]